MKWEDVEVGKQQEFKLSRKTIAAMFLVVVVVKESKHCCLPRCKMMLDDGGLIVGIYTYEHLSFYVKVEGGRARDPTPPPLLLDEVTMEAGHVVFGFQPERQRLRMLTADVRWSAGA